MVAPRNRRGHYMWKHKFKWPPKISALQSIKRTLKLAQSGYGVAKKKIVKHKRKAINYWPIKAKQAIRHFKKSNKKITKKG